MVAKVLMCPFCGNKAPQEIEYQTSCEEEVCLTSNPDDSFLIDLHYYITRCSACCSVLMYCSEYDVDNLNESQLCYPHQPRIGSQIPDRIAKNYQEAKKVKRVSPSSFAILIRRGLEFICEDQHATGHSLKQKLAYLAIKGIIPQTLAEMGDTLRFLGNISAHATDFDIDSSDVQVIDEFFLSMIEYIYVAPSKIANLKESIEKKLINPFLEQTFFITIPDYQSVMLPFL